MTGTLVKFIFIKYDINNFKCGDCVNCQGKKPVELSVDEIEKRKLEKKKEIIQHDNEKQNDEYKKEFSNEELEVNAVAQSAEKIKAKENIDVAKLNKDIEINKLLNIKFSADEDQKKYEKTKKLIEETQKATSEVIELSLLN